MSDGRVIIFDTTLRDGEQAPGFSMNTVEKLEMARQLARLNVDVIEAGFPISSDEDFEATREVARQVGTLEGAPAICGLSRVGLGDIGRCWEAVKYARKPRIHTFVATSDIHLKYKLRMSRSEVLTASVDAVLHALAYCEDVECSPEDASRSDFDYMCDVLSAVIEAGAGTINIPDTVGYAVPREWGERIARIREKVQGVDKVVLSVHCHNDLGQAVANSLTALMHGARQIECTINGIGERAGNASLEEIVMALRTRKDFFVIETGVRTEEIFKTSRLLSHITGVHVQPNKAIVGENAFAHEAGIHQDGVLKEKLTYEIMKPEDIGRPSNKLVLGKHSGRHALAARLKDLGLDLAGGDLGQGRAGRGGGEGGLRRHAGLREGLLDRRHRGERARLPERAQPHVTERTTHQGRRGRVTGRMATHTIAVLPGDGIGQEVTPEAVRVLRAVGKRAGVTFEFEEALIGGAAIDATGTPLPPETLALCRKADAILFGAVGGPKWDHLPQESRAERGLLALRKELDLYANLRPAICFPMLIDASPLKRSVVEGTDIMVIRELTGGLYFGEPRGRESFADGGERAINTMVYTTREIECVTRVAFEVARKRRRRLASVDQANVLVVSQLWREVVTRVARDYPDVTLEHVLVDNCAMALVHRPSRFDTIVTENTFGDILSDEAAILAGSMGMLPSASLGGSVV